MLKSTFSTLLLCLLGKNLKKALSHPFSSDGSHVGAHAKIGWGGSPNRSVMCQNNLTLTKLPPTPADSDKAERGVKANKPTDVPRGERREAPEGAPASAASGDTVSNANTVSIIE
jgi:hypothetical protein